MAMRTRTVALEASLLQLRAQQLRHLLPARRALQNYLFQEEKRVNRATALPDRFSARDLRVREGTQATDGTVLDREQQRLVKAIKDLGRQAKWQEAVALLAEAPEPSSWARVSTMDACTRALELQACRRLFNDFPEKSVPAYNIMILLLGRLRKPAEAEATFKEMKEAGLQPTDATFGSLLSAYSAARDIQSVLRVLRDMKAANMTPSVIAWGTAMSACAKVGDSEKTLRLFKEMQASLLTPDRGHYNSLVVSCARRKDHQEAMKFIDEMRKQQIEPDLVTYTSLLSCQAGPGALERGDAIFAEMRQAGIKPDIFLYNALVQLAVREGDAVKARQVLSEMASQGLEPNHETAEVQRQLRMLEEDLKLQQTTVQQVSQHPLPPGWQQAQDPSSGLNYYWREDDPTGTTTWERPR